ncbi:MAG: hypothetical protein RLZ98_857 [Pseudomonadota bacterium]|jgi:uncharacterized membrane protein YedE/YeeE
MTKLMLAVVLGTAFGFALNRVGATNPDRIVNMLRLTDLSLAKVILFAIGFSSLLLFAGLAAGIIDPGHISVKGAYVGVVIGGLLLGLGWAISGYCPGTGIAAAATGRWDAVVFVLGGLVGAFFYALAYASVKATGILEPIFGGNATLAVTGKSTALLPDIPAVLIAGVIGVLFMALAAALPRSLRDGASPEEAVMGEHKPSV